MYLQDECCLVDALQIRLAERSRQQWRDRTRRLGSPSASPSPTLGSPTFCEGRPVTSQATAAGVTPQATAADDSSSERPHLNDLQIAALAASPAADDGRIVGVGHSMGSCVLLLYAMA